ncbi:MAG: prolyl oligopeptidase family serine peptidase [Acidobacteriota bacterium]|nr:prolyl oligopeptidase family serine peptidase [Acidobacteriota bacterium]
MKSLCLLLLLPLSAAAQELTLEKIMADPVWMGKIPRNVRLSEENNTIYFQVLRERPLPAEWMKMSPDGGAPQPIDEADRPYVFGGKIHRRGSVALIGVRNDLWISREGAARQPLISSADSLAFKRFIDDNRFLYSDGQNLHLFDLSEGSSVQITDMRFQNERPEPKETFLASEERKLLGEVENLYIRDDYNKKARETNRVIGSLKKPTPTWLGKGMSYGGFFGSGSGLAVTDDLRFVALTIQSEDKSKGTSYAQFINKKAEVQARNARPKVGRADTIWKLGILDRDSDELHWLDVSDLPEIKTDRLAAVKEEQSEEDKKFAPKAPKEPKPRNVWYLHDGFSADGKHLLVTVFSHDYKDRWILLVDTETRKWKLVDHHYDEAWVQYVMRGIDHSSDRMGSAWWNEDRDTVYFMSDKTNYQHLYRYPLQREETVQVTTGNFEIYAPFQNGDRLYFHANKTHPGERHFYSMPVTGGEWTQHTKEPGFHLVELSEDGTVMLDTFSTAVRPPYIRIKKGKKKWRTIYDGRSDAFRAIKWAKPEFVTYANRDGLQVHARLYKPKKANGAGVVFVHGAGYLQNAHKGWSGYFREYMFHNLLMREGYTVLDPDFQASAGYGRNWRTAIYRHMGGKDLTDVVDGGKWLTEQHGVDSKRLGVYGGSYGGFITFMAMFTTPDVFACGAALRPVSDWAHYNHWYTARILNTPTVDPIAYRRSSPIYFAEGLKGKLLMCHGMVDSNVQYQDVVRLSQKLIELGKKDWELASYPVEPHGFRTPSGWYDEYRRIHELFTENLK